MKIRNGTVEEAVDLALKIPDFVNPYNLRSADAPRPTLDHVLIAEADGRLVGFRAGKRFSPDTFAVWLAGVLPEYRRQGIAGELYRIQKAWLKSQGYQFVRTHVRDSNRVMLRILLDRGYHIEDVIRHGDVRRNKIVFVKNLWPADEPMTAGSLIVGLVTLGGHAVDLDVRHALRDLTISWLRFKYGGRIIEDSSVDAILRQASESGHRYCLILAPGNIVSHAWALGLVKTLEEWVSERPFFVAGEILGDDESGWGLSTRCLLVSLQPYRSLGKPEFGEPGTRLVELAAPARTGADPSLQPGGTRVTRAPRWPGWNFVSTSLSADIPVLSLPEAITSTLFHIAPEGDRQHESFRRILGDGIVTSALPAEEFSDGQRRFLSGVQRQVQNCRRGIFVWNFESYDDVNDPPAGFASPVSTLYSVAAGLKSNWILQTHGFDEETTLVYLDYSEQALRFKRLLHEEFDGEDYAAFLRYLFKRLRPGDAFYQMWGGFSPEDMDWKTVQDAWTLEIARWGGRGGPERVLAAREGVARHLCPRESPGRR